MRDMRLIGRDKPAPVQEPAADDLDEDLSGWLRYRRLVIRVLIAGFVLSPAVALLVPHGLALTGRQAFLVLGTCAFALLVDQTVLVGMAVPAQPPNWAGASLPVTIALGGALFAAGQMSWLTALAVASAGAGRLASSTRVAGAGLLCCTGLAAGIGIGEGLGYGNTVIAIAVVVLAGMLAYSAERRNALVYRLRETRAELARAAVADERLRISRDLHDLLGHSLSVIALKAELAGRLIGTDPDRAAREIADLETVARRSLTEVRQAVTGYRQPSLAAELVSSRRMLASAGTDCQVRAPSAYSLPPTVDALLAWTVREGATNIVRHAAAKHAEIDIEVTDTEASALVSDDGAGPSPNGPAGALGTAGVTPALAPGPADAAADPADGAPTVGSGLAGLTERAARLGGTLSAGAGARGGFWLRVNVPLVASPDGEPDGAAALEPGPERMPS